MTDHAIGQPAKKKRCVARVSLSVELHADEDRHAEATTSLVNHHIASVISEALPFLTRMQSLMKPAEENIEGIHTSTSFATNPWARGDRDQDHTTTPMISQEGQGPPRAT